jgi:hypothetical protein
MVLRSSLFPQVKREVIAAQSYQHKLIALVLAAWRSYVRAKRMPDSR